MGVPNAKKTSCSRTLRRMYQGRYVYLLMLPGIIYFIIFKFIPMGMLGIIFQDYNPYVGMAGSQWVGLKHFKDLIYLCYLKWWL